MLRSSRDLSLAPLKSNVDQIIKLQNQIANDTRRRTTTDNKQNPFTSLHVKQASEVPKIQSIKNRLQENIRIRSRLGAKSLGEKSLTVQMVRKSPIPKKVAPRPRRNLPKDSICFQRKYQVLGLEQLQGIEEETQLVEQMKSRNPDLNTCATEIPRELFINKWERQELKASWDKCMKRINQEIKDTSIDDRNSGGASNRRPSLS